MSPFVNFTCFLFLLLAYKRHPTPRCQPFLHTSRQVRGVGVVHHDWVGRPRSLDPPEAWGHEAVLRPHPRGKTSLWCSSLISPWHHVQHMFTYTLYTFMLYGCDSPDHLLLSHWIRGLGSRPCNMRISTSATPWTFYWHSSGRWDRWTHGKTRVTWCFFAV